MKKILGILSWSIAIIGTLAIVLTTMPIPIINNYIVFYVGIAMLIIGIIGILLTCEKSRKFIWNLLDFI